MGFIHYKDAHPTHTVIPAQAGIFIHQAQDPGFCRDDGGKESRDDRIEKTLRETPSLRASVVKSLKSRPPYKTQKYARKPRVFRIPALFPSHFWWKVKSD